MGDNEDTVLQDATPSTTNSDFDVNTSDNTVNVPYDPPPDPPQPPDPDPVIEPAPPDPEPEPVCHIEEKPTFPIPTYVVNCDPHSDNPEVQHTEDEDDHSGGGDSGGDDGGEEECGGE